MTISRIEPKSRWATAHCKSRHGLAAVTIFGLAWVLVPESPARAGHDGLVSAYESGNYDVALQGFSRQAESGDQSAYYYLGLMHNDGKGVAKDAVTALSWFLCAERDGGHIGNQASSWRSRITAQLDEDAVAAAFDKARDCGGAPADLTQATTASSPAGTRFSAVAQDSDSGASSSSRVHTADEPDTNIRRIPGSSHGSRDLSARVVTPYRHSALLKSFFFPADATFIGFQYIAQLMNADDLFETLRDISRKKSNVIFITFAVAWWLVVGKLLMPLVTALLSAFRPESDMDSDGSGHGSPHH